ncbi:MAG TPA: hypothetical protein VFS15_26745 [Kofleriaceae bacterium]|nr:hypothetical protein [Kofleriaceae bacterium]
MKVFLLVVALAVIPACGQGNDIAALQHEAATLTKYYRPELESLDKRMGAIFERGKSIPGNLPGIQDVGRRLQEARETLAKLHELIEGSPTKPALDKQAEAAAKDGKALELEKIVDESEEALAAGVTIVNDDLAAGESWLAQYDRGMLAMATPAPAQAAEPAPTAEDAAAPTEPVNTPQTGQPPAAQEPAPQH